MAAKTINGMIKAIETRHCIRKLWRCRAGWGMMFVRVFDVPIQPPWPKPKDRNYGKKMAAHDEWQAERTRLWESNQVVYSYYPTVEACVKAEYRARVINEVGLP